MNFKYFLVFICCFSLGIQAQEGFTIHGKIGTLDAPAKAFLRYKDDGKIVTDSAILHNGQFTFTGKLTSPVEADITIKHGDTFSSRDNLHFYIENADITVTAQDNFVRNAVVKGSLTNDEYRRLSELQRPYRRIADSVKAVYNARTLQERKDTAFLKAITPIVLSSRAGYDSVNRSFIAKHPNSYISLVTFRQVELGYNFNPDTAALKFEQFPLGLRESALGKQLAAIIEKGRKTNIGIPAMDFVQKDTIGKPVKLSDFLGQYVLLDFWASWCSPCRAENPNLLKAYNKYKDKNFTILGVSLDDEATRKAWINAVEKDGLPWTQVSELKGFKSKAAVLYGVTAIPSNFLIDPDGKIIARNLRGEELEKKLASIFK